MTHPHITPVMRKRDGVAGKRQADSVRTDEFGGNEWRAMLTAAGTGETNCEKLLFVMIRSPSPRFGYAPREAPLRSFFFAFLCDYVLSP